MIVFKLFGMHICFDFSFFAVIAIFLLFFGNGLWVDALLACIIHELSHLLVMRAFNIVADRITFYGAGIRISSGGVEKCAFLPRCAIYSAGCFANLIMFATMLICSNYCSAAVNILICIFNLLPFGELDGGALLRMILICNAPPECIDVIEKIVEILVIILLSVSFVIVFGGINISLFIVLFYFLVSSYVSDRMT